jgi:hypothetical protein
MNSTTDANNENIFEGDKISGYSVKRVVTLPEISSFYYELEHEATGAGHIHIGNKDRENTFCVAFKTVPADSTGVAHILEHTVLCGSGKFPVRDPFFSMIRRSLNTFMNAFTSSDWTMYPFSTQNKKDFYNLMDVYLDSAFFPLLDELSFMQEGHRIEVEKAYADGKPACLVYKGVVYNEMKGAMSSPDQVMARSVLNALYPLTTYGFNSGGDPALIPSLTHRDLVRFHERHYHPSNSFFYTYGDIPLRESLAFIEGKILGKFTRSNPDTEIPAHPRWKEPRKVRHTYPLSKNEDPLKKNQVCTAWLAADINDIFEVLALVLLEHILLGNASSPLRKALIDSGLGSSLCDSSGYDPGNRDTMFVCGLKDVKEEDAGRIERIVFETLLELAEKGIDKELIESAIHQVEFHRKEITNTPYPYGIKLLLSFTGTRLHGGDPSRILNLDEDLNRIREELRQGSFFEDRIRKYFIENPHRVLLTLAPDQDMERKEAGRVAEELERIKAGLDEGGIERIIKNSSRLEELQGKKEDLSCLPTLELSDIPSSVDDVKEAASYAGLPVSCYEQPTGGICYFNTAAGGGLTDEKMLSLVPFFCFAFSRTGTLLRDYSDMAKRMDTYTGGISLSANARREFGMNGCCVPFISFSGKCLARNIDMMFDIIGELLQKHDFSDLERIKKLLLEYRAGLESAVVHAGHRLALSLASRSFSGASGLNEKWNGVHQLLFIKRLTEGISREKLKSIADDLSSIALRIFNRNNVKLAVIGDARALASAVPHAAALREAMADGEDGLFSLNGLSGGGMPNEGWSTSSSVSFVAYVIDTVRMGHEDAPVLAVAGKLMKSLYLHREIREKGGAYGGYSIYNPEEGLFSYASYRDPHIINTLKVYGGVPAFIGAGKFSDEDVKEAILQVCAEIDKPDPPGPAAKKAFYRKIVSLSDEMRASYKKGVLAVTREKIMATSGKYFGGRDENRGIAVISGEEQLEAANEQLGTSALKLFRI